MRTQLKTIPLVELDIEPVNLSWYIGRVPGAVWFGRSRAEVRAKHRAWALKQKNVIAAIEQYESIQRSFAARA